MEAQLEKKTYGSHWRQFAAACLFALGWQGLIFSSIGNYITPIMSVTGQGQAVVGGAMAVGSLFMMILLGFVGKILRKFKLKPLLIACAIIGLGAFITMGYMKSIVAFYVLFPIMMMGGAIPIYVAGPMLVTNWFEAKKGLLTGAMMVFGNVGAIIGSLAAGTLLGSEPYNTQLAFTVMGVIAVALIIIGASMAIISPRVVGLEPYGASGNAEGKGGQVTGEQAEAEPAEVAGITSGRALKSPTFYALFLIVFLLISAASFCTLLPNFATLTYAYSNAQGSIILAVFNVGSTIGGLLWGALDDRIGVTRTTTIAFASIIVGLVGLAFASTTFAILLVFACIFGFGAASGGVQAPMLTARFFGQREYGAIYSKVQMAQSAAGLIAVVGLGAVVQATGSYLPAMVALIVLMVIAIVLLFVARGTAIKLWKAEGQEPPKM